MQNDEIQVAKPVSIIAVIAIITCFVILSIGSNNFLDSQKKTDQVATNSTQNNTETTNSTNEINEISGTYRGLVTILNPQLKFTGGSLILTPTGRFSLQTDAFNLSFFKNDQLKVNDDYPFLYFNFEGNYIETENGYDFSIDTANYRFDQEEISLDIANKAKVEQGLKRLGISFEKFQELPIRINTRLNPNQAILDLVSTSDSNFLLNIQMPKI